MSPVLKLLKFLT